MTYSVIDFGARGDGVNDDFDAIQSGLNAAAGGILFVPAGDYRVGGTLRIPSDTALYCNSQAHLFLNPQRDLRRGDFLLTNAEGPCRNITVVGGVWDGSYDGENVTKPSNLFDPDGWSGALIGFSRVDGLKLRDMRLQNSTTYYMRFDRVQNFEFDNLTFCAKQLAFNQDGLHFGGGCRNGVVRRIFALDGETNDDLIALNADDSIERIENLDMTRDTIENISFEEIFADNCYTAVRMLSVNNPIRHISFKNVSCGCRIYAVNMDSARYCQTPLFDEADYPDGVGNIEDISFDGFTVFDSGRQENIPLFMVESRCRNFTVKNFRRNTAAEHNEKSRTLLHVAHLPHTAVTMDGKTTMLETAADVLDTNEVFTELSIETK